MQRSEHRIKARGLADLLLPFALIDDGILLQQDGSLLAGWVIPRTGHDVRRGIGDGRAERPSEPCAEARVRLDDPVRRDSLLRSGLSRARRVSRSYHPRNR